MPRSSLLADLAFSLGALIPAACQTVTGPAVTETATTDRLLPSDLAMIDGAGWTGVLTYINYSDGSPSSIPIEAAIDVVSDMSFVYSVRYPDEPKYNEVANFDITGDGTVFSDRPVEGLTRSGDSVSFSTVRAGEDDNRPADIRITYTFAPNAMRIRKDVLFADASDWMFRNEYVFSR